MTRNIIAILRGIQPGDAEAVQTLPERACACEGHAGDARAPDSFDGFLPGKGQIAHRDGAGPRGEARRRGAGSHGRARRASRRRTQDGECRSRSRPGCPGAAGRPSRAARLEPHRHRRFRQARSRRAAADERAAAGPVDANLRHAHPSRTARLQTEAALRSMRGA